MACDLGADLIVMGNYRHLRMSEMLLGGATAAILDSMTVPVSMSH
jgi:nucleotide-binding universal stress UspA family protein